MSNGFGADFSGLMKQAQKMQKDVERIKSSLAEMVVDASAGGGAITVHANGAREVLSIKIKPEVVDPDDLEELEDLAVVLVHMPVGVDRLDVGHRSPHGSGRPAGR